jgi:hypothetical protein
MGSPTAELPWKFDPDPAMRASVDSDGGWPSLLEMYRHAA